MNKLLSALILFPVFAFGADLIKFTPTNGFVEAQDFTRNGVSIIGGGANTTDTTARAQNLATSNHMQATKADLTAMNVVSGAIPSSASFATGSPVYVESDTVAEGQVAAASNALTTVDTSTMTTITLIHANSAEVSNSFVTADSVVRTALNTASNALRIVAGDVLPAVDGSAITNISASGGGSQFFETNSVINPSNIFARLVVRGETNLANKLSYQGSISIGDNKQYAVTNNTHTNGISPSIVVETSAPLTNGVAIPLLIARASPESTTNMLVGFMLSTRHTFNALSVLANSETLLSDGLFMGSALNNFDAHPKRMATDSWYLNGYATGGGNCFFEGGIADVTPTDNSAVVQEIAIRWAQDADMTLNQGLIYDRVIVGDDDLTAPVANWNTAAVLAVNGSIFSTKDVSQRLLATNAVPICGNTGVVFYGWVNWGTAHVFYAASTLGTSAVVQIPQ